MTTAKRPTALQRAKARIAHLERALENAVSDSTAHADAAAKLREELAVARSSTPAPPTGPVKSFPDFPTWEEKCRAAWGEVKRLEDERQANAKQIYDFNIRLGINDTNMRRIKELELRVRENRDIASETRANMTAEFDRERAERRETIVSLQEKLEAADARIEELEAAVDGEPATAPSVCLEDEIEALGDVIRSAKAIRRRWRAGITE